MPNSKKPLLLDPPVADDPEMDALMRAISDFIAPPPLVSSAVIDRFVASLTVRETMLLRAKPEGNA
jgi:hypothetical protein